MENATKRYMKHIAGFYERVSHPASCPHTRSRPYSRDSGPSRTWQMAANRYTVPLTIGASRKGMSGAYWHKLPKLKIVVKADSSKHKPSSQFYNIHKDPRHPKCTKHKGQFIGNARARRPTERCMVSNLTACYRNPSDPGPTTHFSHVHELAYNKKKITTEVPFPHLFERRSCVPEIPYCLVPRHISFLPGPARYAVHSQHFCPCSIKLVYNPYLQWDVDRQKRLKFRRQPFTRIKAKLYCAENLKHVVGQGHRHLFKNAPKRDFKLTKSSKAKPTAKVDKPLQLYADAKYMRLITSEPERKISFRAKPLVDRPPRVRYNTLVKRTMRRHLQHNKKLAFNSSQPRFPDLDGPAPMTERDLRRAKARLPPDRQLNEYPVMTRSPEEITSKLHASPPAHQLCHYELELRKRLFKFQPLPAGQTLVSTEDVRGTPIDGKYQRIMFYGKPMEATTYYKSIQVPTELPAANE